MSETAAGEMAYFGSDEIVNASRTLAYLNAGYGPQGLQINGGCVCADARLLAGCDSLPYSTPAADDAPWYDPTVPESADFAGFLPTVFEGMGSTYTRETFKRVSGGSVPGRLRAEERILTWRGYLFGRSCCAVQYGLRWLTQQLTCGPCGDCEGRELDLMVCCPSVTGTNPLPEPCDGLPEIAQPAVCVCSGPYPDAFRSLQDVVLLEGPTILSERRVGCRGGCPDGQCTEESCIIEVEFSLVAGNPYFYGCPSLVIDQMLFPAEEAVCDWVYDPTGASCPSDDCPADVDCTEDFGLCPKPDLPNFPTITDNCHCDPIAPVSICASIDSESFGTFFEGVAHIEIYSGDKVMRATSIKFYENPQERDCSELDDPCYVCDELVIRYMPAFSTLMIDGTTRRITLICQGGNQVSAEHLVTAPFSWPILRCTNYCICFTTEGLELSEDANVSIVIYPREM